MPFSNPNADTVHGLGGCPPSSTNTPGLMASSSLQGTLNPSNALIAAGSAAKAKLSDSTVGDSIKFVRVIECTSFHLC